MKRSLGIMAVTALFFASCTSNQPPAATTKTETPAPAVAKQAPASSLSTEGNNNLLELLAAYYELKDAMVASDSSKANAAASHVLSAGETMTNTLNSDTAHKALLPNVATIMKNSEAITSDKQNTLELKRASFEKVSDALYALLKDAKLTNGGVYHQFCPMAFNDKGAYWLSKDEEIKNPYFGKKMLECGEVKDSL